MADELRVTMATRLDSGNLKDQIRSETLVIDQATAALISKVVAVTTSETDLDTTGITTLGWAYLKNLDATNYVQYGPKNVSNAMQAFGRLEAGEAALFRLEPGITLRWIANTATCNVLVKVYAD
jgi:hypothetical protein